MTSAIELFAEARKETNKLDVYIPDKAQIMEMVNTSMAMIAMSLNNGDVQGAVDVTDKMDVVEKWFQKLVNKGIMQQAVANRVIKGKFDGYRMMGEWLNVHIAPSGGNNTTEGKASRSAMGYVYYADLPIHKNQGGKYQKVAALPDDKYEEWFLKYLDDDAEDVDQLFFNPLYRFAFPPTPKEDNVPEGLSPAGGTYWKALESVKNATINYGKAISKKGVEHYEIFKMVEYMDRIIGGLYDAREQLAASTEPNDDKENI